jgi:hypothetical protein
VTGAKASPEDDVRAAFDQFVKAQNAHDVVHRNLTFVGGRARGRFSYSATMPGQRLLPLAANWSFRPIAEVQTSKLGVRKLS